MSKGKLYLIPSPLGDNDPKEVIPSYVLDLLHNINHYVVEEFRTVRRYLSRAGLKGGIEQLQMYELNEHTPIAQIESYEMMWASFLRLDFQQLQTRVPS